MKIELETRRYWWASFSLLVLLICYEHWQIMASLYTQWTGNEDFSHGLLIIPISLYFIWKKRSALSAVEIRTDWRALFFIAAAIFLHVVGELGTDIFTNRLSVLCLVLGCVWLSFGFDVIKILRFPLAFLLLMLPLPGFLYRNITFPLQLLSSRLSVDLMQLFGIMVYREGNIIDMGFTQFEVAVACNGLRFIMPLVTVGVLFAFAKRRQWWERVLLIAITVPLAILANVLRIAGTGMLSIIWGEKVAEGFFHSFSGWAVFMACFSLFLLFDWGLRRISNIKTDELKSNLSQPKKEQYRGMTINVVSILITVVLILTANMMVGNYGSVKPVKLKKPLAEFPLSWKQWNGRPDYMAEEMWDQVGAQEYIMIKYQSDGKTPVEFYSAYYEYQRKLGDFVHSPKLCLPGAGWFIEKSSVRKLESQSRIPGVGDALRFNEIVVERNGSRQLVYYWYQGRGRNFTSEYTAKFFLAFDGVFRRRTDGALVRLIAPIYEGNTEEDARETLDAFALFVSEELSNYFP